MPKLRWDTEGAFAVSERVPVTPGCEGTLAAVPCPTPPSWACPGVSVSLVLTDYHIARGLGGEQVFLAGD